MKKLLINSLFILWGVYALIFGYIGFAGFGVEVAENGFRQTLCGTTGCSNAEYIGSLSWLLGIAVFTYLVPICLLVVWLRKRKKGV